MTADAKSQTSVDVLVFGAGAGGMTAALVCALEGLDVLLCEKIRPVGGTTATSAGTIWVPGTKLARDAGHHRHHRRREALSRCGRRSAADNRRDVYLETGKRRGRISRAKERGEVLPYVKHPDYQANRPGLHARRPAAGAAAVRRSPAR